MLPCKSLRVFTVVSAVFLSLLPLGRAAAACSNCFAKRWVYYGGNLATQADVDRGKQLITEAAATVEFASGAVAMRYEPRR